MLTMEHVRKNYGSFSMDCSLEVPAGRVTGLIGQNGAGKSTAFKSVLGLIRTDGGDIRLFGKQPQDLTTKDREKLGVVLSDSGFTGYLRVKDLLPVLENFYSDFDRAFFEEGLRRFGLPTDKKLKEYSTGMKAKFKVLVAVSHGANFLILDEPTAGLDVMARDEVLDLLREFMAEKEDRSILISSHISGDLESLCDDLYMIHDGKIILHEETDVLLSDYAVLKVTEEQFAGLDKGYLLRAKREPYGFSCLTAQASFYAENHPDITMEKAAIDDLIPMMIRGERL